MARPNPFSSIALAAAVAVTALFPRVHATAACLGTEDANRASISIAGPMDWLAVVAPRPSPGPERSDRFPTVEAFPGLPSHAKLVAVVFLRRSDEPAALATVEHLQAALCCWLI